MNKSPDEIVADKIISELKQNELIQDSQLDEIKPKLKSGDISSEDWRLIVEKYIEQSKGQKNGTED